MSGSVFDLKRPCVDCPFVPSRKFPLKKSRVREILSALIDQQATFSCHKTVHYREGVAPKCQEQHCAGALILLESIEKPNQMMRIAERLGFYDRWKLDMNAECFRSPAQMLRAKYWRA